MAVCPRLAAVQTNRHPTPLLLLELDPQNRLYVLMRQRPKVFAIVCEVIQTLMPLDHLTARCRCCYSCFCYDRSNFYRGRTYRGSSCQHPILPKPRGSRRSVPKVCH